MVGIGWLASEADEGENGILVVSVVVSLVGILVISVVVSLVGSLVVSLVVSFVVSNWLKYS